MKRIVRLNERELRRMITEAVNVILESETPILHGEGNGEVYRDDAFVTDWRDNPNDDPNKVKAPYNSYVWNKNFSKHYPTPESFWNPKDTRAYKYTKDLDKIHKEEDKFKKSEDLKTQRALDAADSRPLHRKGSLNRVGLDENHIRKIVGEAMKRVINEGGHLYHKDEDGNVWTNSKETYRGVPGSTYIWHGEWADPEVLWKGQSLNVYDIEDGMWSTYKEECEENGEQPTVNGFDAWVEAQGTDWIASQLDDLVWAAQGCP